MSTVSTSPTPSPCWRAWNGQAIPIGRRLGEKLMLPSREGTAGPAIVSTARTQPGSRPLRAEVIVGESDALKYVMSRVEQVATTDATVLLSGETGTGKELFARAIHNRSQRRDRPFVVVNCAALPATLIESELFGRERGAFTGAHATQIGRFELANRGTIF